jgi:hypothetical protein
MTVIEQKQWKTTKSSRGHTDNKQCSTLRGLIKYFSVIDGEVKNAA